MPDNDASTYQKKMSHTQQANASVQALITIDRAQKLDLLVHLINNLTQSLVVCGPAGIGKSRLLKTLVENNDNDWAICMLSASSEALSFEKVQVALLNFLAQHEKSHGVNDLKTVLDAYDKNNRKVVLIIDDAGLLMPGLISALIQYANGYSCLRLVLSMTHDDLHIKSSSDALIDESHFIELPPLTKKQCMLFLQNLSAQPTASISFNAVTDVLADNLYSVTHGIPGKIITELPRLSEYRSSFPVKSNSLLMVMIGGVLLAGLAYYLYEPEAQTTSTATTVTSPLLDREIADVDIVEPVIGVNAPEPESIVNDSERLPEAADIHVVTAMDDLSVSEQEIDGVTSGGEITDASSGQEAEIGQAALTQEAVEAGPEAPAPVKPEKIVKEMPAVQERVDVVKEKSVAASQQGEGATWVKRQNSQHYTMQLMVLSQQQAVMDFMTKNARLGSRLNYIKLTGKQGQHKYVLLYGAFASSAEAEKAKKKLPAQLRNAWIRRFKDLQKQITAQ